MNYLSLDIGGSGIKYAIMNENFDINQKGTHPLSVHNHDEFIKEIKNIYEKLGKPEGGIAVSYCGELDEKTGFIYNGGSYAFNTKTNLKKSLEDICQTEVSIENDGNCAALAELHKGVLQNYQDAVVMVIGTGLGGAIILDKTIRQGIHKYAGSLSFMASDIGTDFAASNMTARKGGFHYLISEYNRESSTAIETGYDFFELVNNQDELASRILTQYCRNIANILLNIHLILDIECIAIGGGISAQPVLQKTLHQEFDKIFQKAPIPMLNMTQPELMICQHHNDSNLIGALCHHLEMKELIKE